MLKQREVAKPKAAKPESRQSSDTGKTLTDEELERIRTSEGQGGDA